MNNHEELFAAIELKTPKRIPYTYDAREETDIRLRTYLGLMDSASVADHFACNRFSGLWSALGRCPDMPARRERHATDDPHLRPPDPPPTTLPVPLFPYP